MWPATLAACCVNELSDLTERITVMPGNSFNPTLQGDDLLSIPPIQEHLLRSERVRQTFRVQVMQPASRAGDQRRYPVVYVTDANWVFDMFKSISYLLQMFAHDAPPFILVGIGYPGDSPYAGSLLRARDFTFPPYPDGEVTVEAAREYFASRKLDVGLYEGTLLPEEGAKSFYGGEDFRSFIAEELLPFIDSHYATDPTDRIYFGHSGGGFFGLFTLFTQPELFKSYIVSSPGLLYHGEIPGGRRYEHYNCGTELLQVFLASGKQLSGRRLYISAGAEEELEPALGGWQMVSGFHQFVKLLRNAAIPGLELMTEVFPGETHITVWPVAFIHGVQVMLGTRRVTRSVYF